jgi:hydrogenase maturation protease
MPDALVIAVGNPFRRDDGIGLVVLDRLSAAHPDVAAVEETGEPAALVSRWSGRDCVVLVDAVSSGAAAGTIHRLDCSDGRWSGAPPSAKASTHGLGVADAVELGSVLGRLPARLVLLGVETADVSAGVGLTDAVAAVVDDVVARVMSEVSPTVPMTGGR